MLDVQLPSPLFFFPPTLRSDCKMAAKVETMQCISFSFQMLFSPVKPMDYMLSEA